MSDNGNQKVIWGFLAGFFAGVAAGVLLTTDERKEAARAKIDEANNFLRNDVGKRLEEGMEKMNELAKTTFDNINTYASKVIKKEVEELTDSSTEEKA